MSDAIDSLRAVLGRSIDRIRDVVLEVAADGKAAAGVAERARQTAPIVWMLGKVGAGKSSIVRTLTGSSRAEIGSGFRPCTRASEIFEFPPEAPVVRFLDTRGLGEVDYDPAEDIAFCEGQAHLVLVAARALDPVQEPVLAPLRQVRARHPDWPVIVAVTALHDGYRRGDGHVLPYPFAERDAAARLPADLARALADRRAQFENLPGRGAVQVVPVDFTLPEDGLTPHDYGVDALWQAIAAAAPSGIEAALRGGSRAHQQIMGHAMAAAAVDLFPVAGLVAVPAVQGRMLHRLAEMHGADWNRRTYSEFAGCLSGGFMLRYGSGLLLRQAGKLIPGWGWLAGAAGAAAMSFATTFALGKAACAYLDGRRGNEVAETYSKALKEAIEIARRRDWRGGGPA